MNRFQGAAAASVLALTAFAALARPQGPSQTPASAPAATAKLAPEPGQAEEARLVASRLQNGHYRRLDLGDRLSERMLERYIDFLDPWHGLFTSADIARFDRYRFQLDDALRSGKLDPAFEIFRTYQDRVKEECNALLADARGDLTGLKLDDHEMLEIDRKDAPWPKDRAALEDLWRRRFEDDVLSQKLLPDRTPEEIRAALERRYESQLRFADRTRSEDVFQLFINALAQSYDPHTQYLGRKSAEDFDIDMSLSVEGIGALLGNNGEFVIIERLIPGGPAEESGLLKAADRIMAVGQGDEGELVDVVGWRTDEVADLIRGPAGSTVRLSVLPADQPAGAPPRSLQLTRAAVSLEEQAATSKVLAIGEEGKQRKIGLIELPAFYMDFEGFHRGDAEFRSTTRDVAKLLQGLSQDGVEGIVLDLRGNGGGSLIEVNELGGLFFGQTPMVQVRDAGGDVEILVAQTPAVTSAPLLVLVDRLSASASEIFAGAVQDYGRGLVVGQRTFGKGTVQRVVPVTAGELILTQAKFYRVTGASTQLRGVTPDLSFPDGIDPEEIGEESLPEALPWDEIKPVEDLETHRGELVELLPELRKAHDERAAHDPEFVRQSQRMAYLEELGHVKEISLDEAERRREQEQHETRLLSIENEYRKARGEEPLEHIDPDAPLPGDDGPDPFQQEAARILADYIDLSRPR
jgi:carboxyl-terminal processing protease